VILVLAAGACGGSSSQKAAGAALTLGMGVAAAAINRAATGDCWATCPTGTQCDKASGTCVPLPCRNACPADSRCIVSEGRETCVRSGPRDIAGEEIPPAPESDIAAADAGPDPCRGLCLRRERCTVNKGGVADCVPY